MFLLSDQLKGFRVYITRENMTSDSEFAYENTEIYGQGIFRINISSHFQQGRYLTIYLPKNQLSARPENGPLVLCEVEVFTPGKIIYIVHTINNFYSYMFYNIAVILLSMLCDVYAK